jgi:2-amino-4-hydroxy-6-hydroxymethyldihydropteridine diphosphokinase
MILIALGANLPADDGSPPLETCRRALAALDRRGVRVAAVSGWYRTPPDPPSDQPDYVNGVARIETALPPRALLTVLHDVERRAGRERAVRNEARPLDLDLIDYCGAVLGGEDGLVLPHPRAHGRLFVLRPLADVAPDWRHPVSLRPVTALIAALGGTMTVVPVDDAAG